MAFSGVIHVELATHDPRIFGCFIDAPRSGAFIEGSTIELGGWVLGREMPVTGIEVLHQGRVVRRCAADSWRPDLKHAFPNYPWPARGFWMKSTFAPDPRPAIELSLRAVLGDHSRVPFARLVAQRIFQNDTPGQPLVSIVIPCYRQARFLSQAIESAAAQTHSNIEIIVVDDGSPDNVEEVARRYPGVRCVRQENGGLSAARNCGLRHSSGEYVIFLDADDALFPEAVSAGLHALRENPAAAFAAGRYQDVTLDGQPTATPELVSSGRDPYLTLLRQERVFQPGAVIFRRAALELVNGFDPSVDATADLDIYLRIASQMPICCHSDVTVRYRQHGSNMSGNALVMLSAMRQALKRHQLVVARQHANHRAAFAVGQRRAVRFYGDALVNELRDHIAERRWKSARAALAALVQHYPVGLLKAVRSAITDGRF